MVATTQTGKSSPKFNILFGMPRALDLQLEPYTVIIVPSRDKWNDFGFRTRVEIHVRLPEGLTVLGAHLGYVTSREDEPSDLRKVEELLERSSTWTVSTQELQQFFTMLTSLKDYRRVVQSMGTDNARAFLVALNDVVALAEFQPKSPVPKSAAETKVFQKSFVRKSEAFFAYKNASSILRGLKEEEFRKMSRDICVDFQLSGRKNRHQLKFRFDHEADLPKRISVVIGKNGVGKSQALGMIVREALAGSTASLNEGNAESRVLMNRLLAFAPTNESTSVFPSERRRNAKVWYKRFSLNRGGRGRYGNGVSDTVLQVLRSDEHIGEKSRWDIFLKAIEAIADWREIVLLRRDKDEPPIYVCTMHVGSGEDAFLDNFASIDLDKDPVRAVDGNTYPLSSGEISFLRFAAQACLYIENGSLLLLDEPETHLHPNFISNFVAILDNMLALTGSAAIITTHSAYFVREVFSEQVTVLRMSDGFVTTAPLRLQTFGADVGTISYFVFEEDEPSKLVSEVEKRLLARFSSWPELYEAYGDELSPKLLGSLRLALESGKQ